MAPHTHVYKLASVSLKTRKFKTLKAFKTYKEAKETSDYEVEKMMKSSEPFDAEFPCLPSIPTRTAKESSGDSSENNLIFKACLMRADEKFHPPLNGVDEEAGQSPSLEFYATNLDNAIFNASQLSLLVKHIPT